MNATTISVEELMELLDDETRATVEATLAAFDLVEAEGDDHVDRLRVGDEVRIAYDSPRTEKRPTIEGRVHGRDETYVYLRESTSTDRAHYDHFGIRLDDRSIDVFCALSGRTYDPDEGMYVPNPRPIFTAHEGGHIITDVRVRSTLGTVAAVYPAHGLGFDDEYAALHESRRETFSLPYSKTTYALVTRLLDTPGGRACDYEFGLPVTRYWRDGEMKSRPPVSRYRPESLAEGDAPLWSDEVSATALALYRLGFGDEPEQFHG